MDKIKISRELLLEMLTDPSLGKGLLAKYPNLIKELIQYTSEVSKGADIFCTDVEIYIGNTPLIEILNKHFNN